MLRAKTEKQEMPVLLHHKDMYIIYIAGLAFIDIFSKYHSE
jgi:hypothetical protein